MESQATTQPRVLTLGHSFVRRMRDFLRQNHVEKECRMDFKLHVHKLCVVTMLGIGGRTILVLEMESNDLCDMSCNPQTSESLAKCTFSFSSVLFLAFFTFDHID